VADASGRLTQIRLGAISIVPDDMATGRRSRRYCDDQTRIEKLNIPAILPGMWLKLAQGSNAAKT
jgi:hypothetical protein